MASPTPRRPLSQAPLAGAMSPWEGFVSRWSNGCGSNHCPGSGDPEREVQVTICLARGDVPCKILFIGEAPGECIAGDTLIDTAFRDKTVHRKGIPVRDLVGQSGFKVYSLDDDGNLALGTVRKVWRTGYRKVYNVKFFWWGAPPDGKGGRKKYWGDIRVTENHPFLLGGGIYRSISHGLMPGDRLQPFYRYTQASGRSSVGTHSSNMRKEAVLLLEDKLGRSVVECEECHHSDRNPGNDTWDNLVLLSQVDHARLHGLEDNAMRNPIHKESHARSVMDEEYRRGQSEKMSRYLADPDAYAKRVAQIDKQRGRTSDTVKNKFATDPVYYYRYLKGRRWRNGRILSDDEIRVKMKARFPDEPYPPSADNHVVFSIESAGGAHVYDMEVGGYHNFVANGVFVHNSEDVLGQPFVGPAGILLQEQIIERAIYHRRIPVRDPKNGQRSYDLEPEFPYALTNMVCCIPRDPATGYKATEPDDDQVVACSDRLKEFIRVCDGRLQDQLRLIVAVGTIAQGWLDRGYKHSIKFHRSIRQIHILHPAAIIRANVAQRGFLAQRAMITLRTAVEDTCR